MTQKELSYFEDAIGHIGNITKIINESLNNLEDEKLINFMKNELNVQEKLHSDLMQMLEGKANG